MAKKMDVYFDGEFRIGEVKYVTVSQTNVNDANTLHSDIQEFGDKASGMKKILKNKLFTDVIDTLENYGLDVDKFFINKDGVTVDAVVQSFAKNVFIISFTFGWSYDPIAVYF